jgi:serine/threonine protein kinase/TolB-like protein/Tfp pilus assembly protein PilF
VLRNDIEQLIASHEQAAEFIESPASDLAAEWFARGQSGLKPGEKIGPYEVQSVLGVGGMGEVYLALDTRLSRQVALKLLPRRFTLDPERVRRFEQEVRAASALNHPNFVTIHEIGNVNHTQFMVTEFVQGRTLRQLMDEKPFTLNEALNVAIQVAGALAGAHSAGIVHRDIKPENIMLRDDGYVKILDFGLAKLTETKTLDSDPETSTLLQSSPGLVMGTVQYMSPEQARGKKVDARTDIWSLGVVLYEMLACRVPFPGETSSHVMVALMEDEMPLLTDHADVPPELNRIVTKALRKKQNERYQTAGQLADDLKRLKQELQRQVSFKGRLGAVTSIKDGNDKSGGPADPAFASLTSTVDTGATQPTSTARRLVGKIKRHRTVAIAALLLLVGAIIFVPWFFVNRRGDDKVIDSIAVMPFVNETGNTDVEYLSDGLTETLIADLAQLPKLKVTARNSTFKYKGKEVDPREAGRALGVQAILTGRVLRRGDNFLISVELIDARDATRIWGEQYRGTESDIAAAQARISRELTLALRFHLTPVEQQQLARRETANPKAYELLLKSRHLRTEGGTEKRKQAIDVLQQAIVADPKYSLAYADLSGLYSGLVNNNVLDQKEFMPKSEAASLKALELDDDLAEAHLAMARVKTDQWNWVAAEQEFQRAIQLNPGLSAAHMGYTFFLMIHGRAEEALAEANWAKELDPVSTGPNIVVVYALILSHQPDQALAAAKRLIELDPGSPQVQTVLGQTYEDRGQYRESLAAFQEAVRLGDQSPDAQIALGTAHAKVGELEKTREFVKQLRRKKEYVSPVGLAILHVALREYEQAFALLEQAYCVHDQQLIWIGIESIGEGDFAPVASDPRFVNLMRRLNLKPPV